MLFLASSFSSNYPSIPLPALALLFSSLFLFDFLNASDFISAVNLNLCVSLYISNLLIFNLEFGFMERAEAESTVNSQLWLACAGTLVRLPRVHSSVFYFPQGHLEHSLSSSASPRAAPASVSCRVAAVRLLADPHTDEVFAKLRLLPLNFGADFHGGGSAVLAEEEEEEKVPSFSKMLTQSDANNGGGFSVPRYCAETIFPKLDYSVEPPTQTLAARDVHGVVWRFRHIYRGTPRRHLLTTGWSFFVSQKKLLAGDSVVFLRHGGGDVSIGIRRARRRETQMTSLNPSFLGFRSAFLPGGGDVATAVRLAGSRVEFEVEYYPRRRSPAFVVEEAVVRAAMKVKWGPGMRLKMAFETEDSARVSWFKGTVSGVKVVDSVNWPHSPWRILQVVWDEPDLLENVKSVNPWLVELVSTEPTAVCRLLPFSPPSVKRLRMPQHPEFLFSGQFLVPSSSDNNPFGPSRTLSAGIQGARQNHFGDLWWDYHHHTMCNINKLQTGLVTSVMQTQPCQSAISANFNTGQPDTGKNIPCSVKLGGSGLEQVDSDREKPAQFLLFGQTIVIEQQSLSKTLDLNVSELQNPAKSKSEAEIEESSEMPFHVQETGYCKVFLDIEDVGRSIDLSTLGSYAELYERLANLFEVKRSDIFSCVLYRDSSGALKRMGEEPFSVFRRMTRSLTILLGSGSKSLERTRSSEHSNSGSGLDYSGVGGPVIVA